MSISDPKVSDSRAGGRTAAADEPNLATPPPPSVPHDNGGTDAASPPHTLSDRVSRSCRSPATSSAPASHSPSPCSFSRGSPRQAVNASGELLTNMKLDSLFPVAVVLALALGGVYRVAHRRLQPERVPRVARALLRRRLRLRTRPGHRRVPAWRIRNAGALRHPARHGGHRRHRRHHRGTHRPALLLAYADHDPGAGRRFGHDGRSRHAQRSAGARHDPGRTCGRR